MLFSCSVMSDYLWSHGLQHTTLPCPSLSTRVCSNSYLLNWWCYPPSHPVAPFSSSQHQSLFQSQLFSSDCQNIGASSAVLPMNIQGWFLLGLTGLILLSKGLSRVFSRPQFKSINSLGLSLLYGPTLTSTQLLEKPQLWLDGPWSAKWCLCFLICGLGLSKLFFQGASILISWLQWSFAVILEPKKIKSVTVSIFPPSICNTQ